MRRDRRPPCAARLLSLLHRDFAGAGLGHDTMPAGYLVANGAAAAAALVAAGLTAPRPAA